MKKVKSKKEIIKYAGHSYTRTLEKYNEEGQLSWSEEKTSDNKLIEQVSYEYNEKGLLVLEHFVDPSGIQQHYHFTYDENDKIAKLVIEYSNGGKEIQSYERSENKEVLTVADENGVVDRKEVRTFNADGKLIRLYKEDSEGKISEEEEYVYDDEYRVIEKKWKNENEEGHVNYSFEIDEDGDAVTNTYDAASGELIMIKTVVEKEEVTETIKEIIDHYTILSQVDKANRTETVEVESLDEQIVESEHTEFDELGNPLKTELFDVRGLGKNINGDMDQYLVKEYEYEFWEA